MCSWYRSTCAVDAFTAHLFIGRTNKLTVIYIGGTVIGMDISYNVSKNGANVAERGLSFEAARHFEMETALVVEDLRQAYPERRFQALGLIGDRLHMLVFTLRNSKVHVISLRKANLREVKRYEQANQ